jgi:hypothetical protein
MAEDDSNLDSALEGMDEDRRSTLKRLIGTGAFVAPVVVSFTMAELSIDAFMHAAVANLTTTTTTTSTTTAGPGTTTTPAPGATTTPAPGATTTPAPGSTTTTPPPGHPTKS